MINAKFNNPAGRLYAILAEAKTQSSSRTFKEVWSTVFGVPLHDMPGIFYRLVLLQDLTTEVERKIREFETNHEVFLEHLPKVRSLLNVTNFDIGWSHGITILSEGVLVTLQFCSALLDKHCPEKTISDTDLKDISSEIDALFSSISTSDLKKSLKALLLDLLESMRRAIVEYRIRGARGLRENLFSILECISRRFDIVREAERDPQVKGFWLLLTKYDTLASLYVNAPQILAGFSKLLPPA